MGAITELRRAFTPPTLEQAQAALTRAEDAFDAEPNEATTKALNDARNAHANAELRDRKKREREQAEAERTAAESRAADEKRFADLVAALDGMRVQREVSGPAAERMASLMGELTAEAVALDECISTLRQKRDQAVVLAGKLGLAPTSVPPQIEEPLIWGPVKAAVQGEIRYDGAGAAFLWMPKV